MPWSFTGNLLQSPKWTAILMTHMKMPTRLSQPQSARGKSTRESRAQTAEFTETSLPLTLMLKQPNHPHHVFFSYLMHVCKLGLFYMRGVFSCWCLHTETQTKWIQWWPVLVYFLPQISIVFVIFFLSYLFLLWTGHCILWHGDDKDWNNSLLIMSLTQNCSTSMGWQLKFL